MPARQPKIIPTPLERLNRTIEVLSTTQEDVSDFLESSQLPQEDEQKYQSFSSKVTIANDDLKGMARFFAEGQAINIKGANSFVAACRTAISKLKAVRTDPLVNSPEMRKIVEIAENTLATAIVGMETTAKVAKTIGEKVSVVIAYNPGNFTKEYAKYVTKNAVGREEAIIFNESLFTYHGKISDAAIHELTHKFDRELRIKHLSQKGKEELAYGLRRGFYNNIQDLPDNPEFYDDLEFYNQYIKPLEKTRLMVYYRTEERLQNLGRSQTIARKEATYAARPEELLARVTSQFYRREEIEAPEALRSMDYLLDAFFNTNIDQLFFDLAQIPDITKVSRQTATNIARSGERGVYYQLGGIGGAGVPDDKLREKIRQLIQQRLSEIMDQLSPEKLESIIDQVIQGKSRIRAGGERFRTGRIRQALEKWAGEQLQELQQPQEVRLPIAQRVTPGSREAQEFLQIGDPADDALKRSVATKYGGQLTAQGIDKGAIEELTKDLNAQMDALLKVGKGATDVRTRFTQLAEGGQRLHVVLSDNNGRLRDFERSLAKVGEEFKMFETRQGYKQFLRENVPAPAPLTEGEITQKVAGGLARGGFDVAAPENLEASRKLAQEAKRISAEYDKLGLKVTDVTTRMTPLADGTNRLQLSFKSGADTLNTYQYYLQQVEGSLVALTRAELAAQQARKFTPRQVENLQQEYPQAFEKAREANFAPESLQRAVREYSTGITRLRFATRDANGQLVQMEMTVDRFGRTLVDTQKRFRSFGSAITRDIGEAFKWSIAIGAVYGPLRKLQDLITTAIDNEAKLADITIAVGQAQRSTADIFADAASAAQAAGESINGVLEGYSMAYRAAGGIQNSIERTATANVLLKDSLILSKLSTLDQAEALDILSGSLRQVADQLDANINPLQQGITLLDKWVAVSNKANVDLATLATAFSITSESAENAGVSVDELTGIVGALSEKTGSLGGRETGNAVRALIGGVYTESAAKALQTYGIAVTDTSGKMREFLDIMTEVYVLNQRGLISEDQLSKLALALGGGVRRQQQYLAFLTDIQRVNEIAAISSAAHGEAQEALSIKLDTVQTAVTKLGNSFQELAQTMGTKGGVLDTIKALTDFTTVLVGIMGDLMGILGKAGPALLTTGIAYSAFFRGKGSLQGTIGSGITNIFKGGVRTELNSEGEPFTSTRGQRFLGSPIGPYATGAIGGALLAAPSVISSLGEGDVKHAGITMGSAILGTIIAGGNPLGGVVGTVMADTFIEGLKASEGEIEDILTPRSEIGRTTPFGSLAEEDQTRVKDLRNQIITETGGELRNAVSAFLNRTIFGGQAETPRTTGEQARFELEAQISDLERIRDTGGVLGKEMFNEERYNKLVDLLNQLKGLEKLQPVIVEQTPIQGSQILEASTRYGQEFQEEIKAIADTYQEQLRQQLFTGEIKSRPYLESTKTTTGFAATIPQIFTSMFPEEEINGLIKDGDRVREIFQQIADVLVKASTEEITFVTQLTSEIFQLTTAIEDARDAGKGVVLWKDATISLAQAEEALRDTRLLQKNTLEQLSKESLFAGVQLPQTASFQGINYQQFQQQVVPLGKDIWEDFLEPLSDAEEALSRDQAEHLNVVLDLADGYRKLLEDEKIPLEFLQKAFDELKEKGEISVAEPKGLGFQVFDVTNAVLQGLAAQSLAMAAQWQTAYGYAPDIQDLITIDKMGIIDPMKADWKIVQFLLGQIADNTEKQLEGVFNLPEGANFWFPSSVLPLLERQGGGGGGGLTPGDITDAINNSNVGKTPSEQRLSNILEREKRLEAADARNEQQKPPTIQEILANFGIYTPTGAPVTAPEQAPVPTQEPVQRDFEMPSWIQRYLLENFGTARPMGGVPSAISPSDIASNETVQLLDAIKNMNTKPLNFRLQLTSNTQLIVDGRVLANVIKPYLTEDLLSSEGTTGSYTKNSVI